MRDTAESSVEGCSVQVDGHGQLESEGWKRATILEEPRLSEVVATYRELGFEVQLVPVPVEEGTCTKCLTCEPDRYRLIYVRRVEGGGDADTVGEREE